MKRLIKPLLLAGIASGLYVWWRCEWYKHREPPPGWSIVCDGEGHFSDKTPEGYVFEDDVSSSRQMVINLAWDQYEYEINKSREPKPLPKHGPWQDCNGQMEKGR